MKFNQVMRDLLQHLSRENVCTYGIIKKKDYLPYSCFVFKHVV